MPVFLFTDIENSTQLWEKHSQAMGPALARHDTVLQELVGRYDGRILRHRGDGISAIFEGGAPLECAIAVQKQFTSEDWGEIGPLRLRLALHAGEAERREFTSATIGQKEEYFGQVLNRTARILEAGWGGQILLTPEVIITCPLPNGASLQDWGVHLLKNLEAPQQIYGLLHPDLPLQTFPPLNSLARMATPPPPCPYRGLFAFREEDAPFFFGREIFTKRLVEIVHQRPMVAVIGPSGSGKSSVVFAGLLAHLRQEGARQRPQSHSWLITPFRPGNRPFYALAAALIPLLEPQLNETDRLVETHKLEEALRLRLLPLLDVVGRILQKSPDVNRLLLVADQFEELYTLCPEPEVRRHFLDVLTEVVAGYNGQGKSASGFVLTLRADFMGQALAHRPFADALQDADVKLGPMTRQELGRAIEKPAQRQGVAFETGLVERILDDVGTEPGNLPLLEFALALLWERQTLGQLTHQAYETIGRVAGALARYADEVYTELSQAQQAQARRLFVQMVRPGEGTEDTRRLATRLELGEANWALVQRLADARLVVASRDPAGQETAEVVHEALTQSWEKLRVWMEADRAFRLWQERLRVALRQWEASQRDEGALLRGALLTEAEAWTKIRIDDLNAQEREFLQASLALRDQRVLEAEAQRQRELAQAQALAEAQQRRAEAERQRAETQARASRRLRGLAIGLAVVFLVAVGAAIMAIGQRNQAEQHAHLALIRQLAAQAILYASGQPDLAMLLGIEANRRSEVAPAKNELLLNPKHSLNLATFLHGHTDGVLSVAFSPDGQTLASGSRDNTIILWNVATGQPLGPPMISSVLAGAAGNVWSVAFSPDGQVLASSGDDGTVILWDAAIRRPLGPPLTGHAGDKYVLNVTFSPDGRLLASAGEDNIIILWDVSNRHKINLPLANYTGTVRSIAFSPNSQTLASTSDHDIMLWDVSTAFSGGAGVIQPLSSPFTTPHLVSQVAFSPNSQTLATGGNDGDIILWDVATGKRLGSPLTGHTELVTSLAFSPDGQILASGSGDNTIRLWDVATGQPFGPPLTAPEWVSSVAFSPDGQMLASGIDNKTIILWKVAARQYLIGHKEWVDSVTFSPDGQTLASAGDDDTIRLWDVATRQPLGPSLTGHTSDVLSVTFSPDGKRLASGSADRTIMLWDVSTHQPLGQPLTGHTDWVSSVAFSPDGQTLASSSADKTIILWDVATGQAIGPPLTGHTDAVLKVAFRPDGETLASSSADKIIHLWDVKTGQALDPPFIGHTDWVWSLTFSPDGQTLASVGNDKTIILWDVVTRQPLGPPLTGHTDQIWGVAFSPDGQTLASGSRDNTVILWDVATRQPLGPPLTGHTDWVWGVAFSPDGQTLASGSRDSTIILWQVPFEPWLTHACRIANRNLTQAEWSQLIGSEVPYEPTCPNLPPMK